MIGKCMAMEYKIPKNNFLKAHGYLFHIFAMGAVIANIACHLAFCDLLHLIVVLLILIPPGLVFLRLMNSIRMLFPFMLGSALAIGLIIQGVLYFIMTLTYLSGYYKLVAVAISVISIGVLYFTRALRKFSLEETSFDFVDLTLYIALYLGLGLFSSTYGNLFDSRITEGIILSPLIERHSIAFANYTLYYNEYPFFTIFGLPVTGTEIPWKIMHLPMPGFVVKSLSAWCGSNLLLALYFTYLFSFFALVFTSARICLLLFNRYTALLVSVIFSLRFMPATYTSHELYLPQLLSLMATAVFILITIDQDGVMPEVKYRINILMCAVILFILLTNNQFLMVFSLALIAYILFKMFRHRSFKNVIFYIFPIIILLITFYIAFQHNKLLYMSKEPIIVDLFRNLRIIYSGFNGNFVSFVKTFLRYDFLFPLCGIVVAVKSICSFSKISFKSTHIFIWSGILVSLIFGAILYYRPGASSAYFLIFSIYFLFVYGCQALSRQKIVPLLLTWLLIVGFLIYPKYYRFYLGGPGVAAKQEYNTLRKISGFLPADAKLILLSDKYFYLDIGFLAENHDIQTQQTCEMFTARRFIFQDTNKYLGDPAALIENLRQNIIIYKITHIITDNPANIPEQIGSGITKKFMKEIIVSQNQKYHIVELNYTKHFY